MKSVEQRQQSIGQQVKQVFIIIAAARGGTSGTVNEAKQYFCVVGLKISYVGRSEASKFKVRLSRIRKATCWFVSSNLMRNDLMNTRISLCVTSNEMLVDVINYDNFNCHN